MRTPLVCNVWSLSNARFAAAARDLRKGGELGIFTPMLFFKARKTDAPAKSVALTKEVKKGSPKVNGRKRSVSRSRL